MRCSTSSKQINDRDFKWTNKWSKSWSRSWSWSYYFQKVKKKSNKETEGFVYLRNMEKNGVIFFVSLHIFDFIVSWVQNISS